jgi:GDPmannose 4,6-dehydratase
MAFKAAGIDLEWKGEGEREVGIDSKTGKVRVAVDPRHYRPTEVEVLLGDPAKAAKKLGWRARTLTPDLVKIMMKHDLERERLRA